MSFYASAVPSCRRTAVYGSVLALFVAACTVERADVRTPSGEPPAADTTRIRAAIDVLARAIETSDLAALDTVVAEGVSVIVDGVVVAAGREDRDRMLAHLEALDERRLRFDDIQVSLAGSTAWVTARYASSAVHAGAPSTRTGVATMVFTRRAGRWWLIHLHASGSSGGG